MTLIKNDYQESLKNDTKDFLQNCNKRKFNSNFVSYQN